MGRDVAIISVVRDFSMYERCISGNQYCSGCRLVSLDNREDNRPVPVLYNSAIRQLLEEGFVGWMVFCHEDWQAESNIASALENLDKGSLYGVIGVDVERYRSADLMVIKGSISQGTKDFASRKQVSGRDAEGPVGTFDCQCLMVHSSLFSKFTLLFDEHLQFDMYVEDFCAAAFEKYGLRSYVIPFACTHWSGGHISGGFKMSLAYVREKYSGANNRYASIAGHGNWFGKGEGRRLLKFKDTFLNAAIRSLYGIRKVD